MTTIAVAADILARSLERRTVETGWHIRSCITKPVAIYGSVVWLCNSAGAWLAFHLLQTQWPKFSERLGFYDHALAAFAGVFILEVVLANSEITLFSVGVLPLQKMLQYTRDPAVVSATNRQAELKSEVQRELANNIALLPEDKLQTNLLRHLGEDRIAQLEQDAVNSRGDVKLYKAMELVDIAPIEAKTLAKEAKKRHRKLNA